MSGKKGFEKTITLSDGSQVKQFLSEDEFKIEMMQLNGQIDPDVQQRFAAHFKDIKASDEFVKRIAAAETVEDRDAIDKEILGLAEKRMFEECRPAQKPQPVEVRSAPAKSASSPIPKEQQQALLQQCWLVAQARLKICRQPTIHEIAELDSDDLADMLADVETTPYEVWHERRFGVKPE